MLFRKREKKKRKEKRQIKFISRYKRTLRKFDFDFPRFGSQPEVDRKKHHLNVSNEK